MNFSHPLIRGIWIKNRSANMSVLRKKFHVDCRKQCRSKLFVVTRGHNNKRVSDCKRFYNRNLSLKQCICVTYSPCCKICVVKKYLDLVYCKFYWLIHPKDNKCVRRKNQQSMFFCSPLKFFHQILEIVLL